MVRTRSQTNSKRKSPSRGSATATVSPKKRSAKPRSVTRRQKAPQKKAPKANSADIVETESTGSVFVEIEGVLLFISEALVIRASKIFPCQLIY